MLNSGIFPLTFLQKLYINYIKSKNKEDIISVKRKATEDLQNEKETDTSRDDGYHGDDLADRMCDDTAGSAERRSGRLFRRGKRAERIYSVRGRAGNGLPGGI